MIRWIKGIFGLGSRVSEFLSSLRPRPIADETGQAAVEHTKVARECHANPHGCN